MKKEERSELYVGVGFVICLSALNITMFGFKEGMVVTGFVMAIFGAVLWSVW